MKGFLIICFIILASLTSSKVVINLENLQFTDDDGLSRIYHGVNAIYKVFPFYPNQDTFDPLYSLCDEDFQKLTSWGFNMIRLYMSWQGTEEVRGQYNTTYIEQVREIVRKAAQYNVSILLDAHQDVMNRKFCGEGMPDWAVNTTNFPAPEKGNFTYDNNGYPNLTQCLERPFFGFYTTENVQEAWENFYANVDGIQESMANFWAQVATLMKDEPNIIGYEIINEPYSANQYKDPIYKIEPFRADWKLLEPFYERVHEKVRAVDNDTILFFEPVIDDNVKLGFNKGPGGPGYNDKQVLSYHIYCGAVDSDGEPNDALVCHAIDLGSFTAKMENMKKLGIAGFLTEFGAVSNSVKSSDELDYILNMADGRAQSWSYWQYKYFGDYTTQSNPATTESFFNEDGSIQTNKIKHLSRTYLYAVCGVPVSMKFDPSDGKFEAHIKISHGCNGKKTQFFASKEFYYPDGIDTKFTHFDIKVEGCVVTPLNKENYYQIEWSQNLNEGEEIAFKLEAKKSSQEMFLADI